MAFSVREIYATYGDKTCVNRKSLHKFGGNPNTNTTLKALNSWGENEAYQTSNVTLNISSTNAADTAIVRIEYLYFDANDDLVFAIQTKTLQGRTSIPLDNFGARWTRMSVDTPHAGDIYVYRDTATNGLPDDLTKIHCHIPIGASQSQKAATSVAGNNYLILTELWADLVNKSAVTAGIYFRTRVVGTEFKVNPRRGISGDNSLQYRFEPMEIIPPNSDIEIYAVASQGTTNDVTAGFDGYFADIISS